MQKIIIDNFYVLNCLDLIIDTNDELSLQVNFDLDIYPNFAEYCADKIMSSEEVKLQYNEENLLALVISCSFALGAISYDENEEIEAIDTNAIGTIKFKKIYN